MGAKPVIDWAKLWSDFEDWIESRAYNSEWEDQQKKIKQLVEKQLRERLK